MLFFLSEGVLRSQGLRTLAQHWLYRCLDLTASSQGFCITCRISHPHLSGKIRGQIYHKDSKAKLTPLSPSPSCQFHTHFHFNLGDKLGQCRVNTAHHYLPNTLSGSQQITDLEQSVTRAGRLHITQLLCVRFISVMNLACHCL